MSLVQPTHNCPQHVQQMEAAVAGFVLRHPGREWRRPCAAPSFETGEGL